MTQLTPIRIMISSRSLTQAFGMPLREIRERLQARLEAVRWNAPPAGGGRAALAGRDQPLFSVWIHENDPGRAADASTFEISLREINRADLIIVLYTGEAGSAAHDTELGICHAEFYEAVSRRPGIVSVVELTPLAAAPNERDARFRKFLAEQSTYMRSAASEAALHEHIMELLQERIAQLVKQAARGGARLSDRGQALDWNQLELTQRRRVMCNAVRAVLVDELAARKRTARGPAKRGETPGADLCEWALPSARVLARIDAVPAALSTPAARELVGQPFLRDHLRYAELEATDLPGLVHLVACHRRPTEAQALRMLGSPDAVAIRSEFGIFAADHVQKIQLVLLGPCGDATAIALALRRFDEWLTQTGGEKAFVERAAARRRILKVLAQEAAQDAR
jgi:hypothetical protein